jgi:DNA-binding winged helix-turn-helix (wHTH) protein
MLTNDGQPLADMGESVLAIGDVRVDLFHRSVTVAGRRVRLRRRQFDLLAALLSARGRVLTRADLLRATASTAHDPHTRTIDVQVGQLRAILGPSAITIDTVRGIGYALVSRAEAAPKATPACKRNFARNLPILHDLLTSRSYDDTTAPDRPVGAEDREGHAALHPPAEQRAMQLHRGGLA